MQAHIAEGRLIRGWPIGVLPFQAIISIMPADVDLFILVQYLEIGRNRAGFIRLDTHRRHRISRHDAIAGR